MRNGSIHKFVTYGKLEFPFQWRVSCCCIKNIRCALFLYQAHITNTGHWNWGRRGKIKLLKIDSDHKCKIPPLPKKLQQNDKVNNNVDSAFIFLMNLLISRNGQTGQVGENWHKDDWDMLPILFLQTGFVSAGHVPYMRRPVVSL